jgi:hypothetical protein
MTDNEMTIPPMPAKVATAIVQVMGAVPKLVKDDRNQHGGYQFTSVDDFLQAIRPLCAAAGLVIVQDEEGFEVIVSGKNRDGADLLWLRMRYLFTLSHVSGETWGHRPARTIMVQAAMGSQAFGAAQSYVLKQFARSLFQIATGDKEDADSHPQTNLPKSAAKTLHGPRNITTLKSEMRAFAHDLAGVSDTDELTALLNERRDLFEQCMRDLPDWWHGDDAQPGAFRRIDDRRKELEAAEMEREPNVGTA